MPAMRHYRAAALVSSLLLLLCVAAWVRSYLPEYFFLRVHRGALVLVFAGEQFAREIDPVNHPIVGMPQARGNFPYDTEQILSQARQWAGRRPKGYGALWQAGGFEVIAYDMRVGYFVLVIPFWMMCIPLAALTAWTWVHWHRQRQRQLPGRCHKCGYDIRASTDRCPECATPVPQKEEASA
jgi:hypothetical protein